MRKINPKYGPEKINTLSAQTKSKYQKSIIFATSDNFYVLDIIMTRKKKEPTSEFLEAGSFLSPTPCFTTLG